MLQSILINQMKKCFKNQTQYARRSATRNVSHSGIQRTHEELKMLMKEELMKDSPSVFNLKAGLESCRKKRKEEAKKALSPAEHLKEYPALKYPQLVNILLIYFNLFIK